uniref:Uncharacterized protein n=1 Tax=Strigamia maritima TaxID=126957 RepID=T1J7Y4_STRMM
MKAKTKLLYGYFSFLFIEYVQTWCICHNKRQEYSLHDDVVENRQDFNKQYINSDEFRNKNNDQRLPQLPQRDEFEQLPDEFVGNNPLKFHVEANYNEDSNFIPAQPIRQSFPINHNWKPRIKENHSKHPKNTGTKWLPMKMPPYLKNPFKHLPDYIKPPWLPKKHFPFRSHPHYKMHESNIEDSEEQDFTSRAVWDFMQNHGINHIAKWSENSDPERGFKEVKVVLPKQLWKEMKNY